MTASVMEERDVQRPMRTVAFMDFGTNSLRLLVVAIDGSGGHRTLHQLKETVRLGEGEFGSHRLQPAAMDRAVSVATRFMQVARAAAAEEVIAVATAATREAANHEEFLHRLRDEAGLDLRVISGREEARLIYLGVAGAVRQSEGRALFVDIGGGSTEVIVGSEHEPSYLDSLKLGAIRVSDELLAGRKGPISDALYDRIRAFVLTHAARTVHELSRYRVDFAVGSSGTIENLADIAARMFLKRPWQRDDVFSYAQCQEVIRTLRSLSLEERRKVPGLNPARADIIIGGVAILDVLMERLQIDSLRFSERGLRDGLLTDYLQRHSYGDLELPLRERSVLQLGRKCAFDETHARVTARLALRLFDSAGDLGLHRLGERERELLEYAALLHHIGAFVSYGSYHKHSSYIVENAELLGFDQSEIGLIAGAVRYHRGSLPRRKDLATGAAVEEQRSVLILSSLLRLAENLDRSQAGNVTDCRFRAGEKREVVLQVVSDADCQVEVWGVEGNLRVFEAVFGRELRVETIASYPTL